MSAIKDIYAQNSDAYLDQLQWVLMISVSALQETLIRAGLTQKVLHKIVNECDETCHTEFLHCISNNFSGTGDKFVVIDESSKNGHTYARCYGCAPIGQDAILTSPFV